MDASKNPHPLARKEGLVIRELSDELLVYDLDRNKAHCLNDTAATVWKLCDGQTSVTEIAQRLESDLGADIDEDVVSYALAKLDANHLLAQRFVARESLRNGRREAMLKLGLTSLVAIPAVFSVVKPAHAQASCLPDGAPCTSIAQCCSGECNGMCFSL
jgi:hypothetical protein